MGSRSTLDFKKLGFQPFAFFLQMNEMQQFNEIRMSGVNEVVVYEAPTKFQNSNGSTTFLEVVRRSDNGR